MEVDDSVVLLHILFQSVEDIPAVQDEGSKLIYMTVQGWIQEFDKGDKHFSKKEGQLFFNALQCSYFSSEVIVRIYFCVSCMTH